MTAVRVWMKIMKAPLKRTPVVLRMDVDDSETEPVLTDRSRVARFELPAGTGHVLVSGVEKGSSRYLHKLFTRGGPQKRENRLAGLLRTKGEY